MRLEEALALHVPDAPELLDELDFQVDPRSGQDIPAAEQRLFDLIWYQRSLSSVDPVGEPGRHRVEATYPAEELGPYTDFDWGMLNGKLFDVGIADTPYPFLLLASQAETEATLAEHLAERGLAVERGTELINLEQAGDRVSCVLASAGGTEVVQAAYVAG